MKDEFKKFTLLVVDDEELLRDAIALDFRRKGFTVLTAKNGTEAFECVKRQKVHLVLSDIRMPGGDGVSLLEQIRAYNPEIPVVILITGHTDVSEEECIAKGARNVVSKPFDRKTLMNSVMDALGIVSHPKAA